MHDPTFFRFCRQPRARIHSLRGHTLRSYSRQRVVRLKGLVAERREPSGGLVFKVGQRAGTHLRSYSRQRVVLKRLPKSTDPLSGESSYGIHYIAALRFPAKRHKNTTKPMETTTNVPPSKGR